MNKQILINQYNSTIEYIQIEMIGLKDEEQIAKLYSHIRTIEKLIDEIGY